MPYALLLIGVILVVSGVKNTQGLLGNALVSDFSGKGNFFYWLSAIGVIGGAGYIPAFRPVSRMLIVFLFVAIFLADGGFVSKFVDALGQIQAPAPSPESATGSASNDTPDSAKASGSTGGVGDTVIGVLKAGNPITQVVNTAQSIANSNIGSILSGFGF